MTAGEEFSAFQQSAEPERREKTSQEKLNWKKNRCDRDVW